jgi:hypothetical protein
MKPVDWTRAAIVGFSVLFAAGAPALAAEENAATTEAAQSTSMFPKGTWTLDLTGAYYSSVEASDETIGAGAIAVEYYFGERHAVRLEALGYALNNDGPPEDDAGAGGLNLGLRYHYLERGPMTLFVEGAVGFLYADQSFPVRTSGDHAGYGTNFNFDTIVGLGGTYRLDEHTHLIAGARFMHISNAQIHGVDNNPSFNGVGGYLGVLFTF